MSLSGGNASTGTTITGVGGRGLKGAIAEITQTFTKTLTLGLNIIFSMVFRPNYGWHFCKDLGCLSYGTLHTLPLPQPHPLPHSPTPTPLTPTPRIVMPECVKGDIIVSVHCVHVGAPRQVVMGKGMSMGNLHRIAGKMSP